MAMSMLEKFVSSLIRQVGRDTGKVVSNLVYKDAHATPIRHVSSQKETTPIDNRAKPLTAHEKEMERLRELSETNRKILDLLKD